VEGVAHLGLPAVEIRLDGVGVELRAVVELDALAQMEGSDLAVRAGIPALGKRRPQLLDDERRAGDARRE